MFALEANTRLRLFGNAPPIPASAVARSPCRLMVVDDDEWMRFYLASILRSASYEVDVGRRISLSDRAPAHGVIPNRPMGLIDPLTNARNARYFARQMAREIQRAKHRQRALSVLSCRIDRLEQMTRVYGRAAADEALCAFADDIRLCLRPGQGWFARTGPDRFVLVLPRTRFNGAERLARKLRRRFAAVPVITTEGSIRCTATIDVSEPWLGWTPSHDRSDPGSADAGPH